MHCSTMTELRNFTCLLTVWRRVTARAIYMQSKSTISMNDRTILANTLARFLYYIKIAKYYHEHVVL